MTNDVRKTAYICAFAALSAAIVIVCIGSAWRYRAPDAQNAQTKAASAPSPASQMALWLMKEGRANLRRKSIQRATYFSELAEFFDPKADRKSLLEGIDRRRREIERTISDEVNDASRAGDATRLSRARARLEQLRKER